MKKNKKRKSKGAIVGNRKCLHAYTCAVVWLRHLWELRE